MMIPPRRFRWRRAGGLGLLVTVGLSGSPNSVRAQQAGRVSGTTIRGSAFDSTAMLPLRDAAVSVAGGIGGIVTDELGIFLLVDVPPGEYSLVVEHPRLDSLGLTPLLRILRVEEGQERAEVSFAVPSVRTLWPVFCGEPAEAGGSHHGVLLGEVLDRVTGVAQPLAAVRATWADEADRTLVVQAKANGTGSFALCGLPSQIPITVQAAFLGQVQADTVAHLGGRPLAIANVLMGLSEPGEIFGKVVDSNTGEPIQSAVVTLVGTDHATVSNGMGNFSFEDVDPGQYTLQVDHLAYGVQALEIHLASQTLDIDARLSKRAIELEGITVTAHNPMLERVGYYVRQRRFAVSRAHFLTGEDLMARDSTSMIKAVQGLPWTRVRMDAKWGPALQPWSARSNCPMSLFVNGMWIPEGGLSLKSFDPDEIEAMEIYPRGGGDLTLQIPGGRGVWGDLEPTCGKLVIWTKESSSD